MNPRPQPQSTGETHYSDRAIQPIEYIEANDLGFHESNVIKYVTRWRYKDGVADLRKALWYIHRLIELAEAGDGVPGITPVVSTPHLRSHP